MTKLADPTVDDLQHKLNDLLSQYSEVEKEQQRRQIIISSMRTTIQALTNPASISVNGHNDLKPSNLSVDFHYPKDTTWREKIILFMKHKNRAITTHDVVKAIVATEPSLTEKKVLNMVSGVMSNLVKERIVLTYKPKKMKGQYYASPSWFENNSLKEDYKPIMKEQVIW